MEPVQRKCSIDESFEYIDYPDDFPSAEELNQQFSLSDDSIKSQNSSCSSCDKARKSFDHKNFKQSKLSSPDTSRDIMRRAKPFSKADFDELFDDDGRLVDEHALRKAVFMGGVDPDIRKEVWQFLFGLYPCTSTAREREEILLDYIMKYHEQKSRWKTMMVLNAKPGSTPLQQGLVARYQIEDPKRELHSPDTPKDGPMPKFELLAQNSKAASISVDTPDFSVLSKNFADIDVNSDEMRQKIDFVKIQSQVYVNRQKIDVNNLWTHIRVIDKDVPRTDRDHPYFK